MRVPNAVHEAGPWRIREIAPDFELEDAWDLPVRGRAEDFDLLIRQVLTGNPAGELSRPSRVLWAARDVLGRLGLGRISADAEVTPRAIPGSRDLSLSDRLPADLRATVPGMRFEHLPFVPVYRTADEFVAEISNLTVHAAMHVTWVEHAAEGQTHRGRIGVYVKPRGRVGAAYMAAIKPFRLWIVFPALMRRLETEWNNRVRT